MSALYKCILLYTNFTYQWYHMCISCRWFTMVVCSWKSKKENWKRHTFIQDLSSRNNTHQNYERKQMNLLLQDYYCSYNRLDNLRVYRRNHTMRYVISEVSNIWFRRILRVYRRSHTMRYVISEISNIWFRRILRVYCRNNTTPYVISVVSNISFRRIAWHSAQFLSICTK